MRAARSLTPPSPALLRFLRAQLSASPSTLLRCKPQSLSKQCCRAYTTVRQPDNARPISTSSSLNQSFWRRLRPQKQTKSQKQHSTDLPPLPGFLDDSNAGLGGRIIKPSNELKLRCTEFDENGNVTLVNGEFRKGELIAKYSLLPRDLRKIDSSVLPHILVRESAILINLLHLRCLIKHNRVLVFDVYGSTDSYAQSLFMYDLEGKLRQKQTSAAVGGGGHNLPYEFRALEAVLISVTGGLESEFEGVREPVVRVLRELEEDIDRDKLRHLLIYSKKLGTFEQKARLVRDAIEDLLEADDDLASMYLSEKAAGTEREEQNHDEIELLLESYHKVADEIVQVSSNLVSAIRNTEEIVRAILDANRNSLMLLDLKFSIGTLGISAGMFIAALYGMNLKNFIEEDHLGFAGISGMCVGLTVLCCVVAFRRLRKVQRISMFGESRSQRQQRRKETRQIAGEAERGSWGEYESPVNMAGHWERHEHLRHEHSPTGQHMHGGARGLSETVSDTKEQQKKRGAMDDQQPPSDRAEVDYVVPPPPATTPPPSRMDPLPGMDDLLPSPRQPAIRKAQPEYQKKVVDHSKHDHYRRDKLERQARRQRGS
ncbi:magnesium ion transporter [Vermiconidia calcicola]|uniref:Magnesium ion transporter n=1 Tax=Vermiconidia calcicola TaxID=1690605 RepID=A0ACC3NCB9_9PEZI|nr:magnesium ion transporter [Vermiconidia calcicola]